jgi:hypothetical protein
MFLFHSGVAVDMLEIQAHPRGQSSKWPNLTLRCLKTLSPGAFATPVQGFFYNKYAGKRKTGVLLPRQGS